MVLGATVATFGHPEGLLDSGLLACPQGDPPDGGWPVIILLHGYGVNKEDFDDLASLLARDGVAALAIDGPWELGGGRRQWGGAENIEQTHERVQEHLAPFRGDPRYDTGQPLIGGFSQGGLHALLLALRWPAAYGGVLAIAPAPAADFPAEWKNRESPHRLYLVCGTEDSAQIRAMVDRAEALWKRAQQPVRRHDHPGGHHFPPDWPEVLRDGVRWLRASP